MLLVDKPKNWTSHDVVAVARGVLGVRPVGHGGTLDPLATGLLPILVGTATRSVERLHTAPKVYAAWVRFGSETATDDANQSEMRPIIEYYIADRGTLQRSFFVNNSDARRERFRKFYADALERIQKLNFDSMSQEGKVDYILFRSHLEHELRQLDIEAKQMAEIDLSSWRVAFVGGEPVRAETMDRFIDIFRPFAFPPSTLRPGYPSDPTSSQQTLSTPVTTVSRTA